MTLVIAYKFNNSISLSSDSRISFPRNKHVDLGIKILSVPVKISSPTSQETGISTLDYDHTLGVAVTGSTMNASIVKESISEMLQYLQYLPGHTDLSMNGIANLVFKVYERVSRDLYNAIEDASISTLILGGYCPSLERIQVFEYGATVADDNIVPFRKEILANNGYEFYGSGAPEARAVYAAGQRHPLFIIREVIRGTKVSSVGGGLQYGVFDENNNFKILGVQDYKLDSYGAPIYLDTLRGLNIYKDEFTREDDGFHIAYPLAQPFQREVNEILDKQIRSGL
ncbi:MAG TPA: hypothetical protein VNY36_05500 [Bacteroidia bacterium]|jgi:hypothetical protein|nr:hypothetical protein [Bacteroidia bacterium]